MRVTIRDVAASLGLSVATVSLALNDSPLVKDTTMKRVKDEAARMGYLPNPYARHLVRGKSANIGLIVPDIQNVFYASLVHHINAATAASGYRLTILISNESPETERRLVRTLEQYNVEAILLAPANKPEVSEDYLEQLNSLGIPLIFASARYPGVDAPCAMSDLGQGMRDVARHVVQSGAKRIVYLTGPRGVATLDIREDSYRAVLKEASIEPQICRVDEVTYENAYAAVYGMRQFPDALMCVNDMMAVGALNALSERGKSVPDEIRVTGFDDGLYARVSATPLTSVRQDIQAIANAAVKIALARIREDGDVLEGTEGMIPCELHVRRSTGF